MTPARSMAIAKPLREDHLGASTYVEKGWHCIAQGDFAAGEATLRVALGLAPSDVCGRTLLAWSVMRQDRYDEAIVILDGILGEDAGNALARASLGYVCLRKDLLREAHSHLSVAAGQMRDPKAALYGCFYLGLLYSRLGDVDEAERHFERTLSLAPNFIEAYYEMGRAFLAAGRPEKAASAWKCGKTANRFSQWGKRCGDALSAARDGRFPPSFS